MGIGDWIAVSAALIAVGSAYAAWLQAGAAKQSASAADSQAKSAERSAEIAESAQKFDRITDLQAAKKVLHTVEAGIDMAFADAVAIGRGKGAKLCTDRMMSAAYDFKYLPVASGATLAPRAKKLHEDCARFSHLLESAKYEIWSKEEIRPECVALSASINTQAVEMIDIIDAEIGTIWGK